jgi:hypothetical protein
VATHATTSTTPMARSNCACDSRPVSRHDPVGAGPGGQLVVAAHFLQEDAGERIAAEILRVG